MAIAAGFRVLGHLDPLHRAAQAPPSSSGQDRPSLHLSERSSPLKNRKREICTSGSVRGEGGNILTYSALRRPTADETLLDWPRVVGTEVSLSLLRVSPN